MAEEVHCSFCDKSQRQVRRMVAGPNANICDECVDICLAILGDPPVGEETMPDDEPGPVTTCALCHLPAPAKTMLAIERAGALCSGCAGMVEAALAER